MSSQDEYEITEKMRQEMVEARRIRDLNLDLPYWLLIDSIVESTAAYYADRELPANCECCQIARGEEAFCVWSKTYGTGIHPATLFLFPLVGLWLSKDNTEEVSFVSRHSLCRQCRILKKPGVGKQAFDALALFLGIPGLFFFLMSSW